MANSSSSSSSSGGLMATFAAIANGGGSNVTGSAAAGNGSYTILGILSNATATASTASAAAAGRVRGSMVSSVASNITATIATATSLPEDLALPIETAKTKRPLRLPGGVAQPAAWGESTEAEKTAAIAMVISLLACMVLITLAYMLYQRYTCKVTRRHKKEKGNALPMKQSHTTMTIAGAARDDNNANETLIQTRGQSSQPPAQRTSFSVLSVDC